MIDHQGEKKQFRTHQPTNKGLVCYAFYADCHHEVKPVTEGYRIALTYNLVQKGETFDELSEGKPYLVQALKNYFSESSEMQYGFKNPKWFVYLLDHQYTPKSFGWQKLKGLDRARIEDLRAAAIDAELDIHLCLAEVHETWDAYQEYNWGYPQRRYYADWDDEEEEEEEESNDDPEVGDLICDETTLNVWINSEGKKVNFGERYVSNSMISYTKENEAFDPFNSEYEGWMGNWGNTVDRWYHRAAVVLWPNEDAYVNQFVMQPEKTLRGLLKLFKASRTTEARVAYSKIETCLLNSSDRIDKALLFELATVLKNKQKATEVVKSIHLNDLNKNLAKSVVATVDHYGEKWLRDSLAYTQKSQCEWGPISDLAIVCSRFSKYPKLVRWLLDFQMGILNKDFEDLNRESNDALDRSRSSSVQLTAEFLKAASNASLEPTIECFLKNILSWDRLFTAFTLAKLADKVGGKARTGHSDLVKKLDDEAIPRLKEIVRNKRKDDDWSILESTECDSELSIKLTNFLQDPMQRQLVWPLATDGRKFIHRKIEAMKIPVTHTTRRTGRPYSLVLSKTKKLFEADKQRTKEAEKLLKKLTS